MRGVGPSSRLDDSVLGPEVKPLRPGRRVFQDIVVVLDGLIFPYGKNQFSKRQISEQNSNREGA